jgi:hypothetical protein
MAVMKVSHAVAIVKSKEMSLQNGFGLPLCRTATTDIFSSTDSNNNTVALRKSFCHRDSFAYLCTRKIRTLGLDEEGRHPW